MDFERTVATNIKFLTFDIGHVMKLKLVKLPSFRVAKSGVNVTNVCAPNHAKVYGILLTQRKLVFFTLHSNYIGIFSKSG